MESAHILWDYLRIDDQLEKSDLILIFGNSDLRTADYAAQLYHDGFAPVVAVSGKEGQGTKGKWEAPEAIIFSRRLLQLGVPSSHIIMETEATNTGENVRFTQQLLRSQQPQHAVYHPKIVDPSSLILVQTPFMGRRVYTTFMKQWEKADSVSVKVTSPPIPLSEYADEEAGYNTPMDIVAEMVRNMQRILFYPKRGFQIKQQVPSNVMEAFIILRNFLKDNR